ncbi:hypothetical protein [Micromonospora sp. 4G55]|uniref:hypothetical protein n=1 Tax=Micromonospora sp. 4G55 TaxID=2806102 RepID=UPI001A4EE653|nr:hypothetical protein [Micromonospora sp. 4G55]MBM0257560.1 hypothetical protein [Micromonospora sp. 4G55]
MLGGFLSTRPGYRPRRGFGLLSALAAVAVTSSVLVGPSAPPPATPAPAGASTTLSRPAATAPASTSTAASVTAPTGRTATATSTAGSTPTASPAPTSTSTATAQQAAGAVAEPSLTRYAEAKVTQQRAPRVPVCGGKLTLGKVEACQSITGQQKNIWTVTTTADQDTLITKLTRGSGDYASAQVTNAAGQSVCAFGIDSGTCRLGPAGTYTITVMLYSPDDRGNYTLAVDSTRIPSACDVLPGNFFSFDSAGATDTVPFGAAMNCYSFDQPLNSVLRVVTDPDGDLDVRGQILDAQHEPVCNLPYGSGECSLSRPGPYRLLMWEYYGKESPYTLKMRRLSNPVGCPAVPLAPFGDPGAALGSGVARANDLACNTFTTDAAGPVLVRFMRQDEQAIAWTVHDTAGQQVCEKGANSRFCALPAAGTYTLLVTNQNISDAAVDYRVGVTRLDRFDGCAATTGTSWDQPALRLHQTSPVQTNCQPFQGSAGDRMLTYSTPAPHAWLVDRTGAQICTEPSQEDGCVLPADGTYRVISYLWEWNADSTDLTYQMQIRRLSDPVGCPTVRPGVYNAAPAGAPGGIRCRILEVPAAGVYRVKAVHGENLRAYARVYDPAGRTVCTDIQCELPAAGRYTLVLVGDRVIDNDFEYAVALLPWQPSGCPSVSDTGWRDAPHRGEFQTSGQLNCLQLPTPSGGHLAALLPGEMTVAASPDIDVLNADGRPVCDFSSLRQYSCQLTGPAPFSVLLSGRDWVPTLAYALGFARTDGPPACPVLPRDATGATVTTGTNRFAVCFLIPTDQHAAQESFTWTRTSGTGDARMSMFDANGVRSCGPTGYAVERTITCTLPAGPVTVLLETDAVDATYRLTHRDAATPAP